MEIGSNDLPSVVHLVQGGRLADHHRSRYGLLLVVYLVLGVRGIGDVDCVETVVVVSG